MNRIIRRYPVLRKQLKSIEMHYAELARYIDRSTVYVANRMRGHGSFTIDEAYAIMSATGLTATFEEVFPK